MSAHTGGMLGVVTVTFNAADFLRPFLDCCLAQTCTDFELLVIDNASADGTLKILSAVADPRLTVFENESNVGYAAACNQGIRHFLERGAVRILFINNDTEFGSELFESLRETLAIHRADAITPRITYATDHRANWYAGGALHVLERISGRASGYRATARPRGQRAALDTRRAGLLRHVCRACVQAHRSVRRNLLRVF